MCYAGITHAIYISMNATTTTKTKGENEMKRNDIHEYKDGTKITFIGNAVMIFKNSELIAYDNVSKGNTKTQRVANFFYKKHILKTYDDANIFTTPYDGYFAEYSPQPGIMVRVIKKDVGFNHLSRVLTPAPGTPFFQNIHIKRGLKVTDVIKERFAV